MLPKIAFGHKKTAFSQAPKPQTAFLRSQPDSAHRFFSSLLKQVNLEPARDYNVVAVSINPAETPAIAAS
ncbi:MAG TPA: hypothetical protein VGE93_13270, partial [Bryobacteraceae bacterium]